MPDIADYFGFGQSKLPTHRGDVTSCPCRRCDKTRGIGSGLVAQSEAVRFVAYLKWMMWKVKRERRHWPKTYKADKEALDKEAYVEKGE
jgi:hypothetical protein